MAQDKYSCFRQRTHRKKTNAVQYLRHLTHGAQNTYPACTKEHKTKDRTDFYTPIQTHRGSPAG
jgi:hypothetical protein